MELPAVSLASLVDDPASSGLPVETTNLFLPGGFRLCGLHRTAPSTLWGYVDEVLACAGRLGVRLMVVGSGGARSAPPGFDLEEAHQVFLDMVEQVQERANPYGIAIAPESLNRTETNVGTNLGSLARALRKREVEYTCDTRHLLVEWNLDHGLEAHATGERNLDHGLEAHATCVPSQAYLEDQVPFAPAHLHLGTAAASAPQESDLGVWAVLERARSLGFRGRVSLECRWEAMERELPLAKRLAVRALRGGSS